MLLKELRRKGYTALPAGSNEENKKTRQKGPDTTDKGTQATRNVLHIFPILKKKKKATKQTEIGGGDNQNVCTLH